MAAPSTPASDFFERQFRNQVAASDYALNPFEQAALPFLFGDVLDLGCGLGNLAMAAAGNGCRVTALDASPTAVADLNRRAHERNLAVEARTADLRGYRGTIRYDCVVSIGLLMFFSPDDARRSLAGLPEMVRPGGIAVVNVLIEGTTFMDMFDPSAHYLFSEEELRAAFAGWEMAYAQVDTFPARENSIKRFYTLIARLA